MIKQLVTLATSCLAFVKFIRLMLRTTAPAAVIFRKFQAGERNCKMHSFPGRLSMVSDEDLNSTVTNSLRQTIKKFAETFSKQRTTVEIMMKVLGFITKIDKWVPH